MFFKPRKKANRRRSAVRRSHAHVHALRAKRLAAETLEPRLLLDGHTALERPTELQYWDTANASSGYNFYGASGKSYLLDMQGQVLHTWPIGTNPHLLANGDVLDFMSGSSPSGATGLQEVDWSGNVVWSYTNGRSTYHLHHDFQRIYDPDLGQYTTIFIANKDYTYAELVAAGANPNSTPSTGVQLDTITEVDSTGTIVWEWDFFDHLVQDDYPTGANYAGAGKTVADCPGKLDINLPGHNLKSDWLHCNSLDFNQSLDQIVVNSVQGEFYVIDHKNTIVAGNPTASVALAATTAGDFLYRFGDPARYGQGTTPTITGITSDQGTKQLGGSHDIQWIADGLPGAGHFLVFNNAEYLCETTPQSYVEEINPYLDASGVDHSATHTYINPPTAGYNTVTSPAVTDKSPKLISKQVVWDYASQSNLTLYNNIGGGAQRLANGDTLICSDVWGYVTEVTPAGKTVWDYIVPIVSGTGPVLTLGDRLPYENSIFRAFRYDAGNSAFSGHTLTAGATIAGRTTVANPYAGTSNYEALQRATEVQYWDPADADNGYTLFSAQGNTYLIDMQGRKVHTWATGVDARLLDSGNLLDWATNTSGNITGLKELDWNGNTVWQYTETRSTYHPHGDFQRIYDPKLGGYATLYLANKDVTAAECIAAGCDPANAAYYSGAQVDTIVEIDASGNIVWEWSFWDHAVQNIDATKLNYASSISANPGKINLNLTGRPVQSNWLDCNSLDYNQTLDQIVVNSRQGEFYILDHGSTFLAGNPSGSIALAAGTKGDFLYRFGDPARYGSGTSPAVGSNWETATTGTKQIGGSSNAQWIAAGLPGAGNLLVFNNNQYLFERSPYSFVFQIDPYRTSSGTESTSYVDPPTAGYSSLTFGADTMNGTQQLSNQVLWKYSSVGNLTLFSHFGSSAQRLPNGNTLVCATTNGYMVEVDSSGNVVWEYINPVTNAGIVTAIGDCLPMTNAAPRATRYAASFAGFTGHTLTPGTTIAGTAYPTITGTTRAPSTPLAANTVTVTSTITDNGSIASATLTYSTTGGSGTTTTPFTETFGTMAVKPWTGSTGADNTWTVAGSPNPFELRAQANYTTSSTACGLEYKCSATTSASIAAANTVNASGTSASIEFHVQTLTVSANDGWALQTDPTGTGNNYVTRMSDSGSSYGFTKKHYDLTGDELTSALKVRFLFTGGGSGDKGRIDLDQVTLTVTSGGSVTKTVPMLDDGAHGDGTSGDHVYGATIPAQAIGTTVSYYVTATDNDGLVAHDPAAAPASAYSYTVAGAPPTIATTAQTPASVTSSSGVWVTSTVTDAGTLTAVNLIYDAGAGAVTVAMADDGAHQDTAAGDHIYGAQIPAFAAGTTVKYYISATNNSSLTAVDPAIEPAYKYSYTVDAASASVPVVNAIPAGSFVMGDHFAFVDTDHSTDELPQHTVSLSAFAMGKFDITNQQYCDYLNSALSQGLIQVTSGLVYGVGNNTLYSETRQGQLALYATANPPLTTPYSGILWNGSKFSVLAGNQNMPMVGIRWEGAAAYCNWLSAAQGFQPAYNLTTWAIDYTAGGYRLPTEAEWEYAANGGSASYYEYTWGNDANTDGSYANALGSGSPWAASSVINQTGDVYPWTTPVGFYDGTLHLKSDYNWPGSMTSYQTSNGANGYGLYDMGGNVWQWTNDWYAASYYAKSVTTNPPGPTSGDLMADGVAYRNVRGGSWAQDVTKARISNRDPVFYRQPLNTTYASVGFRVVLANAGSSGWPTIAGTTRSVVTPTTADAPWVTTNVTDDGSIAGVSLRYSVGGTGQPSTVLTETFAATAATTWDGTGGATAWTVTYPTSLPVAQATAANYAGNACGVKFTGGDSNLTDTMITTTNGLNVAGTTATVQFYVKVPSASSSEGWAFQIDAGTGFATCVSETATQHTSWQAYTYTLTAAQRVAGMKMRFQFIGNGTTDTVYLDDISVTATFGTTTVVPMYDDGLHGDGLAGDGRYGAQLPAETAGTTVCYSVAATDNMGLTSADPATAMTYYSYIVGRATAGLQINELQVNPTSFTSTADYSTSTVGLLTNTSDAYPGYTIVDPMMGKTTYLIDNTGHVVHTWTSAYTPGRAAYLLPNGHLIRAGSMGAASPFSTGGGEGGIIEERDWDGNLLWSYTYAYTTAEQHHDFKVLPNGNVLLLVVEVKSYAECLAAGFNPSLLDSTIAKDISAGGGIQVDSLVEVQPNYTTGNTGTIVWKWHIWDHLIQDYDSSKTNYGVVASHPELIDANGRCGSGTKIIQFWNHVNGIDYNAAFDQILISARNESEVWIIDHGTTMAQSAGHSGGTRGKGGDLIYRWGNPQEYDAGTSANEVFYQQHNATWIPDGYPGAGDILVFDNGDARPGGNATYVVQFTPPVDASGNYTLNTGSAYGPATWTWRYTATPPTDFYSSDVGGAQRLPNGDTLINNGQMGDAFEVNAAGQIVWEYQNPYTYSAALYQGDNLPADPQKSGGYLTAMFRCERYPLEYAAFTGKTLTPGATIEQYRDWIEIHNSGTSAVDLGGMYLTNDLAAPTKWQIPSGTSIAAGGYLLFYADGQTSAATATARHTSFTLSATGGSVGLFDTNGITQIDAVTYSTQAADVSYGRYPDGAGDWQSMTTPTPGAANVHELLSGTQIVPTQPTPGNPVLVTATLIGPATAVQLYYSAATRSTAFLDTFTGTATKGGNTWDGSGTAYAWTVAAAATGNVALTSGANDSLVDTAGGCGVRFLAGSSDPTQNMIAATAGIDASGAAATVQFYVKAANLSGSEGWTFQLDAGSGYVTRLGELTGDNHTWQAFSYTLTAAERVNGLKMRFQFTGDGADDQVLIDHVSLASTPWASVTMADDGLHDDGAAGDRVYGASIPGRTLGATVSWYVAATDTSATYTLPQGAPTVSNSYTVANAYDVLLGRPTNTSVAVSVMSRIDDGLTFYVAYGTTAGAYSAQTTAQTLLSGAVATLDLTGLLADTQYYYRVYAKAAGQSAFEAGAEQSFHTQRAAGETFVFDVQADIHHGDLDSNSQAVYQATAANIAADRPDFLIDLGDTFMTEKLGITTESGIWSAVQRTRADDFSLLGGSTPVLMATGNHESQVGWLLDDTQPAENPAVWETEARQAYFPSVVPGGFYSGSTTVDPYLGQPRDSYYSFNWGNAQFIVLDPYWYTDPKPGTSKDSWGWTLGDTQYHWLQQTLAASQSTFKFVFIHHLVGGGVDGVARGGVELADYFEWGGDNQDGTAGFAAHRPGWDMPIQNLLLTYGVDVVFHGHDHLFVKQDLDANADGAEDLVYLECPQPASPIYNSTSSAAGYGYVNYVSDTAGDSGLQGSAGHIRVTVTPTSATLDYVRAYAAADQTSQHVNGAVTYSFSLAAPTDITLSNAAIAENQPAGTVVGSFSTTDPNAGDTFTYVLVNGSTYADNAAFTLHGGTLQTNAGFDYEAKTSYTIDLRTTDQTGLSFDKPFTISVTNVNESPVAAAGGPYTIGAGDGLQLSAAGSHDPDALSGDSIATYAWDLDNDTQYDDLITASPTATVSYSTLQTLGLGIGTHVLDLQVVDTHGATGVAATSVQIVAAPTVESIRVNDGSTQRSKVTSLTLTFSRLVSIDAGAFEIVNRSSGAGVTVACTTSAAGGKTLATLTFSGSQTEYNSLKDGEYQLTVYGDKVSDSGTGSKLDGDNNGLSGGNRVFGAAAGDAFFRKFGDSDGDRDVDTLDKARFTLAYGNPSQYKWYFDFDGDGDVDTLDKARFTLRYGT